MCSRGVRRFAAPGLLILLTGLPAGCDSSDREDRGSSLQASFEAGPVPPAAEAVFLRLFKASGDLVTLEVVGRMISAPLDGVHIVLSFEPLVVEAFGTSEDTFLGTCGVTRPDNTILVCLDNISNGGAEALGDLLFSATAAGAPSPEVIAGERVLATFTFRALRRGRSSIDFHVAARPNPGGSFSEVLSTSDPMGAAAVSFTPDQPDLAFISVRQR
jgi:hypothetical protein